MSQITFPDFVVERVDDLPEYRAKGIFATHKKTGAQVYHVINDDPENLFAFAFRTLPENSNGVAHILEHTVLCGSRKFPVKDPFLLLLKGSMNTFLNAFTFPDKTVYPASSTVEKDLFNLMEVYGDAVFFPLLKPEMFRQEGHRVEFDANGTLVRTGIVFNEMKGNYSTHDSVAGDWCGRSLFPETAYEHDSGGDPAVIPSLSYEQFKAFHAKLYHPSNSLIFLYGNIPTERYLAFLHERFLSKFSKLDIDIRVGDPKPFTAPIRLERAYPSGAEDEEGASVSTTVNWLLNPVGDPDLVLAFEVLGEILIGSAASPLQRALVDSGLGEDLSSPSGLETELSRLIFSAGLRGIERGKEAELEELILSTLKTLADKGLDKELVEGTIRRFEFRSREIKGGGPFGLRLMRRSLRAWLHGSEPSVSLVFDPIMKRLRERLSAEPRYFEGLIKTWLIGNKHRSTVTVIPDPGLNQREQEAEAAELAAMKAALKPEDEQRIKKEQDSLAAYQAAPDSPEAIRTIPFLNEEDIPTRVPTIPAEDRVIVVGDTVVPVQAHDLYTNGITYIDLCFDLEHLDDADLMYVPLFSSLVTGLGIAGGPGYEESATLLSLKTGGFSSFCESNLHVRNSIRDPEDLHIKLLFRLKALDSGVSEALDLASRLILDADIGDLKRLADLYLEARNEYREAIVPSGSAFASMRAERGFSDGEALEERWRGVTQLRFLEALGADSKAAERLSSAFARIRDQVIRSGGLSVNISASANSLEDGLSTVEHFVQGLDARSSDSAETAAVSKKAADDRTIAEKFAVRENVPALEALTTASKVAFVATSMRGSLIGSHTYSHETLLAHLMRTGFLWERIRMKGGAYGVSASNDGFGGIFTFSSYRDPSIKATLDTFREALTVFEEKAVEPDELLLAKIGSVAREIRPLSPSESGLVSFRRWMYGITDALRQEKRDEMLAAEPKDLQHAAAKLLSAMEKSYSSVIAGSEMVDKEESKHFKPLRQQVST